MSIPTFVVCTGRCGSTMLSNMLRDHPGILSLSEFFSMITDGDQTRAPFSSDPLDGEEFWSIIADIGRFYSFFLRHGLHFPELLYPVEDPASKFSSRTGVPGILLTALPHLTGAHDAVFDRLSQEVVAWPRAMIREHYQRLFGWLGALFGKRQWVERSGSLVYLEGMLSVFPDARFVHLVRDGRDAVLSMQKHDAWRVGLTWQRIAESLGVDPIASPDRTHIDRVPAELRPFLPEHFDAAAFRALKTPLAACAGNWVYQLEVGLKILGSLPDDRLLTLRYEDFFADPAKQPNALAAFLGDEFVDEDWSARCSATVRKPCSTWRDLSADDARALAEACRPGFERLCEAGVWYEL